MGRLLVKQDPHSFAGLHAAPHHRHQFRPYEVLDFTVLWDHGVGVAQGGGPTGGSRRSLDIHRPVGVHVFGVIQLSVSFVGTAHIAVAWKGEAGKVIG